MRLREFLSKDLIEDLDAKVAQAQEKVIENARDNERVGKLRNKAYWNGKKVREFWIKENHVKIGYQWLEHMNLDHWDPVTVTIHDVPFKARISLARDGRVAIRFTKKPIIFPRTSFIHLGGFLRRTKVEKGWDNS